MRLSPGDQIREQMYIEHRRRLKLARCKVNTSPPRLQTRNFFNSNRIKEHVADYLRIKKANNELMITLNCTARIGGRLRTFEKSTAVQFKHSRMPAVIKNYRELEKLNKQFGQRLKNRQPEVECWAEDNLLRGQSKKPKRKFVPNAHILAKYSRLQMPQHMLMDKLMRPQVFLDFYIQDLRPVGRVIIQLYTEACPQVVLAFARVCLKGQLNNIQVKRLFPMLWMDMELHLVDGQQIEPNRIEYDKRALDHNRNGVLHFSRRMQKQLDKGIFCFSISAKPLGVLNGKRVAFGAVKHGHKVIDCMQFYGIKNCGKLTKNIIISKLGLLR